MSVITGKYTGMDPRQVPYTRLTHLEGIAHNLAGRVMRDYNKAYNRYRKYGGDDEYGFNRGLNGYLPPELGEADICKVLAVNPYRLIETRGIGFDKADKIAQQNYDFGRDDPRRHFAGNQHIVSRKGVMPRWQYDRERQKLELRNTEYELDGVIVERGSVWLPAELEAEELVCRFFASVRHNVVFDSNDPGVRAVSGDGLNAEQLEAVRLAVSGVRALSLTGGAGCGKTRTIAAIARAAAAKGKTVRVMAFSGKAAMRAEEAMREDGAGDVACSTIHRALGLPHWDGEKLGEDVVILDEASMIPNWLLAAVIRALLPHATLMLVGDPNQLPPIGYGAPFRDYLELWLPHVHLTQNYRQANQQSIFQFAEAIRTQTPEAYRPAASGVQTHYGIDAENEGFFDAIVESVAPLGLHEFQIVTWTNNICQALNLHIQNLLNPHGEKIFDYPCWDLPRERGRAPRADVRVGDKVLVTDNEYEYGVFNGQTGVVTAATYKDLTLDLGHRVVVMPIKDAWDLLQLGYTVTVHKAQGSGWEAVIVYQPFEVKFGPRRFYYTSATRAKNQLYLITTMSELEYWRNVCEADNDPVSTLITRSKERHPVPA